MSSNQLWGPEEDMPDLISDDSEEEQEAVVARAPRPPRPDAEALLTLGVSTDAAVCLHARLQIMVYSQQYMQTQQQQQKYNSGCLILNALT